MTAAHKWQVVRTSDEDSGEDGSGETHCWMLFLGFVGEAKQRAIVSTAVKEKTAHWERMR